ncbi:ABC transporter permease [bacterium]|nr:ABC transporter permease [bacterium]
MIQLTMALKNTLRQPRRSALLGGAIAFGVVIISLAGGFTSGMEEAVQSNVTLFSAGHVLVSGIAASESGRAQNRISDPALAAKVKEILPEAVSVSPTAQAQSTVIFGSREQQLRLRGIDWSTDRLYTQNLILAQGDWTSAVGDRAIILGAQSARRFGLGLGDSVIVRLSTMSGQQNATEYKLGAVYDDAAAGGMTTAFVPLGALLEDLNMKAGQYQSLAVFLPDAARADAVAAKLAAGLKAAGFELRQAAARGNAASSASGGAQSSAAGAARRARSGQGTQSTQGTGGADSGGATSTSFDGMGQGGATSGGFGGVAPGGAAFGGAGPGSGLGGMGGMAFGGAPLGGDFSRGPAMAAGTTLYRISTVTELSGQMGAVLGSVRWIGVTIFAIMLVLTAAGITNTYRMVLMERTREIGMLRCIGFKRRDIFRTFIFEAIFIALAGSLAGIALSLPLGFAAHLIPFNPSGSLGSALSRGRLLFAPSLTSYVFVIACVMLASVVAVSGPARKASRLLPVEAMRTTA